MYGIINIEIFKKHKKEVKMNKNNYVQVIAGGRKHWFTKAEVGKAFKRYLNYKKKMKK